jgi:hypothetical protein
MRAHRFLPLLLAAPAITASAAVDISVNIGLPHLSIGINVPAMPKLAPVPGCPVYYAPGMTVNFFFYDGMYWVYKDDNWYASSWYNGPWAAVHPESVPVYVLQVPVAYYRRPPSYFRPWRRDAPPRWGEHWGPAWAQRRPDWNRRGPAPAPAPVPVYQRQYRGGQYPGPDRQPEIHREHYHYQPQEPVVRDNYQRQDDHVRRGPGGPKGPGGPHRP